MQVYAAVAPADVREAQNYSCHLAHMAYRIGPESSLLRQKLLLQTQGGLLGISDQDAPLIEQPDALCDAVLRECSRRGYAGVLLDFEDAPQPDRSAFAQRLERLLSGRRTLYVPQSYARAVPGAVPLICTAVSGGNFTEHLQEVIRQYGGAGHLALDVQRVQMDFPLPARTGLGTPLSREAFQSLMAQEDPTVFFSSDLCARYFTYARGSETHFVLFDDAETLRQKLRIGTSLGFSAAFFTWPEMQDLAPRLWRRT